MPMKTIVTFFLFSLNAGVLFSQTPFSLVREFDYQVSDGKANRNRIVHEKQYPLKDVDNRQKVSDVCRILAGCHGLLIDIDSAVLSTDSLNRVIIIVNSAAPAGKSDRIEMEYNSRGEVVRAVVFPAMPAEQAVEYRIEYLYLHSYNYSSQSGQKFITGVQQDGPWVLRSVKKEGLLVYLTERKISNE